MQFNNLIQGSRTTEGRGYTCNVNDEWREIWMEEKVVGTGYYEDKEER